MEQNFGGEFPDAIREFRLPAYDEIPDTGLYLEQAARYVSEALQPLSGAGVTGSMVSNYVKRGLVANPVRKQYGREQIAHLFFIAVAKSVLSIEDLHLLVQLQRSGYDSRAAYNYFRTELERALRFAFGLEAALPPPDARDSREKRILHTAILAIAHKLCLNAQLNRLRGGD